MFNAVLYGWTPEAFPATIRGAANGVASFWGRLFRISSPLIAANLLETDLNGPFSLAGAGVSCVLVVYWGCSLPTEWDAWGRVFERGQNSLRQPFR
jgi:hypothetical protein